MTDNSKEYTGDIRKYSLENTVQKIVGNYLDIVVENFLPDYVASAHFPRFTELGNNVHQPA